jgi:hypothetical protein
MMPTLHWPGVITPGQFGPTRTTSRYSLSSAYLTLIMSRAGMPSVIAMMTLIPAAAASRIASAAPGGGT